MSAGSKGRKESIKVGGISGVGTSEIHQCSQPGCDREFASNLALVDHVIDIHGATAARVWGCSHEGCDLTFPTRGERDGHEFVGHRRGAVPESERAPHLLPRGPSPAERAQVRKPKEVPPMRVRCRRPDCDESFADAAELNDHIAKAHSRPKEGDVSFPCTEPGCGRSFPTAQGLGGHRASHNRPIKPAPTPDDLIDGFVGASGSDPREEEPETGSPEPVDEPERDRPPVETPERGRPPMETPERGAPGRPARDLVRHPAFEAVVDLDGLFSTITRAEAVVIVAALDARLDNMRDGGERPSTPAVAREWAVTLAVWARLTEALEAADAGSERSAGVPVG